MKYMIGLVYVLSISMYNFRIMHPLIIMSGGLCKVDEFSHCAFVILPKHFHHKPVLLFNVTKLE